MILLARGASHSKWLEPMEEIVKLVSQIAIIVVIHGSSLPQQFQLHPRLNLAQQTFPAFPVPDRQAVNEETSYTGWTRGDDFEYLFQ